VGPGHDCGRRGRVGPVDGGRDREGRTEGSYWWLVVALGVLELALPFVWRPDYAAKLASAAMARELNEALIPEDAFRGA